MAETIKTRKVLKRYFYKWTEWLGLRWWKIEVIYYDDPDEVIKQFGADNDEIVIMCTRANWAYSIATIAVNLLKCKQLSNEELEIAVVHELCHILVNEMREGELHHEERVVTGLQRAFLWVEQFSRRNHSN